MRTHMQNNVVELAAKKKLQAMRAKLERAARERFQVTGEGSLFGRAKKVDSVFKVSYPNEYGQNETQAREVDLQ